MQGIHVSLFSRISYARSNIFLFILMSRLAMWCRFLYILKSFILPSCQCATGVYTFVCENVLRYHGVVVHGSPLSPEFLVCSVTILIARRLVAVHFPSGAWGWGRIPMSSRRGRGSAPHQVSAPHGGAAARVGKLMLSWYVLNINE